MNLNEMTFGVEFEVTIPAAEITSGRLVVGGYSSGYQVAALPTGWMAKTDSSIRSGRGRYGVEIVSPVLHGAEGVEQVKMACDWLNSIRATVNRTTGLHVHVGFAGSAKNLAILTGLVAYHEKALYASTGTKAREQNRYTKPIKPSAQHKHLASRDQNVVGDRYHSFNVTNLTSGRRPTVEFRAFAGTTNAAKVLGHLRMCLALVQKAAEMTVRPKWDAKAPAPTSRNGKMGEGKFAVKRFFNCFGWSKGKSKKVYGDLTGQGVPTMEASKKVLLQMATKYDGPATPPTATA